MKINFLFFFSIALLIGFSQIFIFSKDLQSDDKLHQEQFNMQYGIFSLIQNQSLNFANEEVPLNSPEIWERIDKALLKNTYSLETKQIVKN